MPTMVTNPAFDSDLSDQFFGTLEAPLDTDMTKGDIAGKYSGIADFLDKYEAIYNFTGHGSKNQMSKMEDLYKQLDQLVADNNQTYGPGKWLAAYGGDPANKEEPDVGLVMQYLSSKKGVHVLAVQCKEYGDYMNAKGSTTKLNDGYNFVKAAVVYKTEYMPDGGYEVNMIPNPDKPGKMKKDIAFGGYAKDDYDWMRADAKLVGATRYIMSRKHGLFGEKVHGHISCGGGKIARDEMEAAWELGLKCIYLPTAVKFMAMPTAIQRSELQGSAGYGPLHWWAMNLGFADEHTKKPTSTGWLQLKKSPDPEKAKTLKIDPKNGLFLLPGNVETGSPYGFEDPQPPSSSKIQSRTFARPLARKEFAIAITIDRLYNLEDKDSTFDAVFYLQLRCCMGDKGKAARTEKPQMPYLEWKNLCGELKTPAGKSFQDAWDDKVKKAWDEEQDCRTPDWVDKDFTFNTHLTGKFIMPTEETESIKQYPFDFRKFGIEITTDEPQNIIIHRLRENPGKVDKGALMTVPTWKGARVDETEPTPYEPNSWATDFKWLGGFLWEGIKEAVLFGVPDWLIKKCSKPSKAAAPYFLEFSYEMTKAEDSDSGNVYRTITANMFIKRISSQVFWSLMFPAFAVGSMTLLQHWIHPVGDMGERLSYGITMVLAMMALKISVTDLLPKLPNQTYLDRYMLWTFTFIVLLVGASIIPHRMCKPTCEYVECLAVDQDSGKFASSFFKEWKVLDESTGEIWNVTSQGQKNCECDCEADNLMMLVGAIAWVLLNLSFLVTYAKYERELSRTMKQHNLEY